MQETLIITENVQQQQDSAQLKKEHIKGWIIQILYWISVYGGIALFSTFNQSAFIFPIYIFFILHLFYAGYCSINPFLLSRDNDNVTLSSKLTVFIHRFSNNNLKS